MDQAIVTLINQLTVAAVCALAAWFLWKRMITQDDKAAQELAAARAEHLKDMREFSSNVLYDLKARVMVLEDALKIPRVDRMKYLPPMTEEEKKALTDMLPNN